MSAKKRLKPIRISLTEEQIAEVIRNTVKSRKGFSIESLEDRIAPSRIGLPIGGGVEDGLPGTGGDTFGDTGGGDPSVGAGDSTVGTGGYEPPLPGGGEPPLPGGEPPLPSGEPPLPSGEPPLPGLNTDPNFRPDQPFGGGADGGHTPLSDRPEDMTQHQHQQFMRQQRMDQQQPTGPNGTFEDAPPQQPDITPEEMRAHRQAILRQLRGQ